MLQLFGLVICLELAEEGFASQEEPSMGSSGLYFSNQVAYFMTTRAFFTRLSPLPACLLPASVQFFLELQSSG